MTAFTKDSRTPAPHSMRGSRDQGASQQGSASGGAHPSDLDQDRGLGRAAFDSEAFFDEDSFSDQSSTLSSSHPDQRPLAFRKPFASLPPQSVARPTEAELASLELELPPVSRRAPVGSVKPKNSRTYCSRHRLAKNPEGKCILCEREAKAEAVNWKIPLVLVIGAVTAGALLAAYL